MEINQENPYAKYEPSFDLVELPSQGMFYPKVNGEVVNRAKIYHLTAQDENIMSSPNLIQSGQMLDKLLEKKVKCDIPIDDLLTGDRVAILVWLRATMERYYKISGLIDPITNKPFDYDVDLAALKTKDITQIPNQEGLFEVLLPKSGKRIKFRLMTGRMEKQITARDESEMAMYKTDVSNSNTIRLEEMIVSVEGIDDVFEKNMFIKNMPIMDSKFLNKYILDVTPTIDLDLEIVAPSGARFRKDMPITKEFLYPTI